MTRGPGLREFGAEEHDQGRVRRSPLQRVLRDIHAVTQHIATAPSQYESAGRMLVGLPPLHARILW
jgi:hypothetical protein